MQPTDLAAVVNATGGLGGGFKCNRLTGLTDNDFLNEDSIQLIVISYPAIAGMKYFRQ